jgi:hypothetical protein
MNRIRRLHAVRTLVALAGWLTLALPSPAHAQQYLPAGEAYLGSGVEGGGRDFQRARTRLKLGLELRIDEDPDNGISGAGVFDIEPRTAFGADLRYVRRIGPKFAVSAGGMGYFVPAILVGPCAGLEVRVPTFYKTYLALGPEVAVFAFGSDLPDRTVIWQAIFQAGFRVDL